MSNLATPRDRARFQSAPEDVSDKGVLDVRGSDLEHLRKENAELKARIEEMEQAWLDSQREYETLLEEKSEVIRGLHQRIHDLQGAGGVQPVPAQEDELLTIQKELEGERQRLQQDEESLMMQMREMELSMAKERAEMARQRTELQRLQSEFNREIELASRDAELRARLFGLQRRQPASPPQRRQEQVEAARPAKSKEPAPSDATPLPKKANSGLFGRLFGGR
jgi:hypothetical protein